MLLNPLDCLQGPVLGLVRICKQLLLYQYIWLATAVTAQPLADPTYILLSFLEKCLRTSPDGRVAFTSSFCNACTRTRGLRCGQCFSDSNKDSTLSLFRAKREQLRSASTGRLPNAKDNFSVTQDSLFVAKQARTTTNVVKFHFISRKTNFHTKTKRGKLFKSEKLCKLNLREH